MHSHPLAVRAVIVLWLVLLAGCGSSGAGGSTPAIESPGALDPAAAGSAVIDDSELTSELAPAVSQLGWEIQRAYRQDAYLVGQDVELVNVYLRPSGVEPSPEQYVAALASGVQAIASQVFESDQSVTAIDVCFQNANDEPPNADVPPVVRMLGLREDLAPLLEAGVELVDLAGVARQGRLVLFADETVRQTAAWAANVGETVSGSAG